MLCFVFYALHHRCRIFNLCYNHSLYVTAEEKSDMCKSGDRACHSTVTNFLVHIPLQFSFKYSASLLSKFVGLPSVFTHIHCHVLSDSPSKESID